MKKTIFFAVVAVLLSLTAFPQGAPYPFVKPMILKTDRNPCAGCSLYAYAAGTTTPQATYSDSALTVANTNPIVLDSAGRASIWLSATSYKFVLKLTTGATVWTYDNVSDIGQILKADLASTATGYGDAMIGYKAAGTGAVATTIHAKLATLPIDPIADFSADNTGVADAAVDIQLAIDAAVANNGDEVRIPHGAYLIDSTLRITKPIKFTGIGGGSTTSGASAGVTLLGSASLGTNPIVAAYPTGLSPSWETIKSLEISGITFDCTSGGGIGILLGNTFKAAIHHNEFKGSCAEGIRVQNFGSMWTEASQIYDNFFYNGTVTGIYFVQTSGSIPFLDVSTAAGTVSACNSVIERNYFALTVDSARGIKTDSNIQVCDSYFGYNKMWIAANSTVGWDVNASMYRSKIYAPAFEYSPLASGYHDNTMMDFHTTYCPAISGLDIDGYFDPNTYPTADDTGGDKLINGCTGAYSRANLYYGQQAIFHNPLKVNSTVDHSGGTYSDAIAYDAAINQGIDAQNVYTAGASGIANSVTQGAAYFRGSKNSTAGFSLGTIEINEAVYGQAVTSVGVAGNMQLQPYGGYLGLGPASTPPGIIVGGSPATGPTNDGMQINTNGEGISSLATAATGSALFLLGYNASSTAGLALGTDTSAHQVIQGVFSDGKTASRLDLQPYGGDLYFGSGYLVKDNLKAPSGKYFLCIDTTGVIVSQATACN